MKGAAFVLRQSQTNAAALNWSNTFRLVPLPDTLDTRGRHEKTVVDTFESVSRWRIERGNIVTESLGIRLNNARGGSEFVK